MPRERIEELIPHGASRPSALVAFQKLDPPTLGKLIALYAGVGKIIAKLTGWRSGP